MKKSEKLLNRLRVELNLEIPENVHIERTYAGHWQKSAGAFLWITYNGNLMLNPLIGSCQTVTELLKCKKFDIYRYGDIEIMGE